MVKILLKRHLSSPNKRKFYINFHIYIKKIVRTKKKTEKSQAFTNIRANKFGISPTQQSI
jgi:hypothetical protein